MNDRRKSSEERRLERELQEHLIEQVLRLVFWVLKHFWRHVANFLMGVLCIGLVWAQETDRLSVYLVAFVLGYLFFPVLRAISDRIE